MKKLLVVVVVSLLVLACIKKAKASREAEWRGLTESEARSKLDAKLPNRLPEEKRSEISDKIITKMRTHGVLAEEPTAAAATPAGV